MAVLRINVGSLDRAPIDAVQAMATKAGAACEREDGKVALNVKNPHPLAGRQGYVVRFVAEAEVIGGILAKHAPGLSEAWEAGKPAAVSEDGRIWFAS